jgi:hypothetical protein
MGNPFDRLLRAIESGAFSGLEYALGLLAFLVVVALVFSAAKELGIRW